MNRFPVRARRGTSLSFGISYLDDVHGGIYPNDLIVFGAKTGIGKTQLAMLIALSNVSAGKRVAYFGLELSQYEGERRLKYQKVCDIYFRHKDTSIQNINFKDYYNGNYERELSQYDDMANVELEKTLSNLYIYYRREDFTISEFQKVYSAIKDHVDLVIVDDLHYFDLENENENKGVKDILKKMKWATDNIGKPIILVSHVRKSDRRFKSLVPDEEDFHGSSDIAKIATKAFCLAPGPYDGVKRLSLTYIKTLKDREDNSRKGYVGVIPFNVASQRYQDAYHIGREVEGEFVETKQMQFPYWAKRAVPMGSVVTKS